MRKLCVSLMALVAVFFVSCSTETDIIEENDGGKDVTLTISTSPLTKSQDNTQVGKAALIDKDKELIVYFMDGTTTSAKTVASYKLTDTQISDIQNSEKVVTFTNLDPSVVSVYVVANVPSTTLPATAPGTTLDAVNGTVMNIYDQQKPNAESVVLANTDKTVIPTVSSPGGNASNGNAQFTATVVLTPIVSRIQIASITNDGTLTSFNLAGIYIDNFYKNMSIGGALTNPIKALAGESAKFNLSVEGAATPYITNGQLFDEVISSATPLELAPSGKVYGYQFFPTNAGLSTVPYIILKLTNVVKSETATRDISDSETYYVAVKAYKTDVTPPTASTTITEFLAGKIYTIANIPVSEKNLVTDPTKSLINVTVNVTIEDWDKVAIKPDFGY